MQKKIFKIFGSVVIICLLLFTISFLPIFTVKEVTVAGNSLVASDEIKSAANILNKNIFSITTKSVMNSVKKNTFIKNIKITKKYPDKIILDIMERKPSCYIKYTNDRFLYIDDEGFVLKSVDEIKTKHPIITGLAFSSFSEGQLINVKDNKVFYSIVSLNSLLGKYDLADNYVKIDISDLENIHINIYNIDFLFGSLTDTDADTKVQIIKKVYQRIPNYKEVKAIVNLETGIIELIL